MKSKGRLGLVVGGAVLALFLVACQDQKAGDLPPVGQEKMDLTHAQCIAKGGNFQPLKNTSAFLCVTTPKDAGKFCQSANDCESACLARSRTCAPVKPLLGCNEVLTESGLAVTQCLE
ncbi:MAG: hypothetical protein WBA91_11455 [Paracoccaceae bacterium]